MDRFASMTTYQNDGMSARTRANTHAHAELALLAHIHALTCKTLLHSDVADATGRHAHSRKKIFSDPQFAAGGANITSTEHLSADSYAKKQYSLSKPQLSFTLLGS